MRVFLVNQSYIIIRGYSIVNACCIEYKRNNFDQSIFKLV